jgi:acyl dehydratase
MSMPPFVVLDGRRFSSADQEAFARLSGDVNPIHMDPVAARRSVVGAVVVHGVHTVLWALEVLARSKFVPSGLSRLEVRFPKPAYLGDEVTLILQGRTEGEIRLKAAVGDRTVATLRLNFGPELARAERVPDLPLGDTALVPGGAPEDLAFDALRGRTGFVGFAAPAQDFAAAFPAAAGLVGPGRLREFAACSRLVGMSCPGLRSLFSRLSLEWRGPGGSSPLSYEVVETHPQYGLVKMRCRAEGLVGDVEAFSPPEPRRQPSLHDLAAVVRADEFQQQVALVIGGSRGLGELTAKTIAAGGGRVFLTYAVGRGDAARVAEEIREFGGRADLFQYDVTQPATQQLFGLGGVVPTHAYYYATCHISRARTQAFEPERLARFVAYYVDGFYDLCQGLQGSGAKEARVFYPSSVFVSDRPRDLTEYAMAKAAGEVLCTDLPTLLPGIRIYMERLPRLMTDQTSTVMPQELPPTIDTILPLLRNVR